jgi:hypothetical protein
MSEADDDSADDDMSEADDDSADDDMSEADDDSADDDMSEADDDSADAGADDEDDDDDPGADDDAGADDDDGDDDSPAKDDAGATSNDAGLPENGEACSSDGDCNEGATCYEGICVQAGSGLRLSLSWEALADLDIHVLAPNGDEIWWSEPVGGGGFLDVDDCLFDGDFYCVDEAGMHVESVFFETPEAGDYLISVHGYETGGQTVDFTLRAFADDQEVESSQDSVGTGDVAQTTFTYTP